MSNTILNVDTTVAFYFKDHNRFELNQLIQQNNGSIPAAADSVNPEPVRIQLVGDIITNADNLDPPIINISSGNPVLNFNFRGFQSEYRTKRYAFTILDLVKIPTAFISTNVIFTDNNVPVQDENLNNLTAKPASENDVAGKANDE